MHNLVFSQSPLYKQFLEHLKKKYPEEYDSFTFEDIEDKFEIIFNMGLVQSKKFLKTRQTCNLLYNGHPARKDMQDRLGNILFELQKISTFPVVPPLRFSEAIKKVIGTDKRYITKYRDWILSLSNYQARFNKVDLSGVVALCPDDLIIQKDW